MTHLCDANVWVALTLQNHASRSACLQWYESLRESDTLAFCRSTQQAFFRLLTHQAVCREEVRTHQEAAEGYARLRQNPRIRWLEEPLGLEPLWLSYAEVNRSSTHVWMDAYLAAFAIAAKARLVSFDQGFEAYPGLDWVNPQAGNLFENQP